MAKAPFICDEIPESRKGTGLCRDFNPSYDVAEVFLDDLLAAVGKAVQEDPRDLSPQDTLKSLGIAKKEIPGILKSAGLPGLGDVDLTWLTTKGTLKDLLLSVGEQDLYLAHSAYCEKHQNDPKKFAQAGCKRKGHLPIPRGRQGFKQEGPIPGMDARSKERLEKNLPFYAARTQSASLRERMSATERKAERMTWEIEAGLGEWLRQSGETDYVTLPRRAEALVAVGVPEEVAVVIVRHLGGVSIPVVKRRTTDIPVTSLLTSLMGGAPIQSQEGRTWFDVTSSSFSLRNLRGPARDLKPIIKAARSKGGGGRLFIRSFQAGPRGDAVPPGDLTRLDDLVSKGGPLKAFLYTRGGDQAELEVWHSILKDRRGAAKRPDYTTLRGFSLQELPFILSNKVYKPRRKRKGRQHKAQNNPHHFPERNHMAPRRKTRRNPASLYLSNDPGLNVASSYYFPGTSWMHNELGDFGHGRSVPVNRRNPAQLFEEEEDDIFDNPRKRSSRSKKKRATAKRATAKKATRKRKSSAKGGTAKQIAWRKKFATLSRKAAAYQQAQGCSPKKAWAAVSKGKSASSRKSSRRKSSSRGGDRPRNAQGQYMAANNPRVMWPRDNEWGQVLSPYGHGMNLPVNRRNPQAVEAMSLYHSGEADSLQEAWDIVKSNPRRRRRR
jgi:hypothetical protein